MLFNSWEFLVLLLATLALYYAPLGGNVRRIWQVLLLLVASALFYAWNEPRLLLLLFSSCIFNAIAVERILFWKNKIQCIGQSVVAAPHGESVRQTHEPEHKGSDSYSSSVAPKHRNTEIPERKARHWLWLTVALNLAFLAFFKYAGFLANLLPESSTTEALKLWAAGIPLPVGISFYTFQGISLVVDVWRNDISPQTAERLAARGHRRIESIRDTSFYISFFPQLVAGPIVKAHEFVDQIGGKRFSEIDWITVRRCLVLGYFLKIFVADNLSEQTASLTLGVERLTTDGPLNLLPLLYGYSLQIFADFAGYSLIAIGLGALFGYKLPPNFNFPYLSTSITEFWRRWHLSLSSWLRDYLYFPLGGNRKGSRRTYINLFLVMFLGGLWHGAAWKFALWGSLHGLFLAVERLYGQKSKMQVDGCKLHVAEDSSDVPSAQSHALAAPTQLATRILQLLKTTLAWFCTFHLTTALWLTFMMPDMASIWGFFKGVCSGRTGFSGPPIYSLMFYGTGVVLYHAWGWLREHREHLAHRLARSPLEPLLHGVMVFLILTNPGAPRGFIYFQF